ncbi:hypothetical protein [Alicyclobacillus pomorum]|uniref:hypothetical protein n=1 Tax=Alicyclobacillus pomorum TaxID=204470 RepID=UPI0003FA9EE3|nr:hypothetical protein [Alicyclobacillus pomorum]
MKTRNRYVLYFLWSIGAYALLAVANRMSYRIQQYTAETYNTLSAMRLEWLILFVLGMYVGILFVRNWKVHPNWPLLIFVFLPTLLLNPALNYSLFTTTLFHTLFFFPATGMATVLTIVSGCALLVGVFGGKGSA